MPTVEEYIRNANGTELVGTFGIRNATLFTPTQPKIELTSHTWKEGNTLFPFLQRYHLFIGTSLWYAAAS